MIHLDYRDARPIYTQVIDGFREQILSGILQTGDRLPSVRELASQLTINPNTIQRAYRELELQGWIVSVPGKGSFVGTIPTTGEMRDLTTASTGRRWNCWRPEPPHGPCGSASLRKEREQCLKCSTLPSASGPSRP